MIFVTASSSARKTEGFPEPEEAMPGGRRNPHEFGGGAQLSDSDACLTAEKYRRLRIGAAIARGQPTEVAVAFSELSVLLDDWWSDWRSEKDARELIFEDVMAAARAMATIGGQRELDAGSRLLKSAQRVLKAQKKSAVEREYKRSTIARKRAEKRDAFDSDEDEDGPTKFTELPQDIMDLVFRKLYAWDLARAACVSRSWRDTARPNARERRTGRPNRRAELKWEHFAARTPCAIAECRTPHWSSEGFKFDCLVGDKRSPDGKCRRDFAGDHPSGEDGVPTPRMRRENREVTDLYMYSKRMLRDYLYGVTDSSDEDTDSSEGEMGTRFWRLPTI